MAENFSKKGPTRVRYGSTYSQHKWTLGLFLMVGSTTGMATPKYPQDGLLRIEPEISSMPGSCSVLEHIPLRALDLVLTHLNISRNDPALGPWTKGCGLYINKALEIQGH